MTPNDTQMDVLMRRYAKGVAESSISTEHLDADEFNAFAEGALPAATRSRYVSHLADCSECRTVASQLTMAAGIGANAQLPASESIANKTWLQRLSALFSAPALRYATSAVVLLAVVGVALVVWRRTAQQPNSALIARNEPNANQVNAVNPPADQPASAATENTQLGARESGTNVQPTPGGSADKKGSESPVAYAAPPPPLPAKDAAESEATSTIAADRAMKAPRPESTPLFAPPPPGENYRVDTRQREQIQQQQPNIAGAIHGGPRRNESQNKVLDDRAKSIDLAKGRDEDRSKSGADQPASTANKQDVSAAKARPGSGVLSSPSSPPKEADEARKSEEKGRAQTNEPTSVGGRKFRRQGSVWVDLKFKSSMPVITVARGSEQFSSLDSKLRSIAQQLGGEVLVVHKGKAYRIR